MAIDPLLPLYHLGRLTWPDLPLPRDEFLLHVERSLVVARARDRVGVATEAWMGRLRLRDWWLSISCLQKIDLLVGEKAWIRLMAGTVPATGRLLTESLSEKARALLPGDEEAREQTTQGFWGLLLAGNSERSEGPLHRYDGTSPLVPWLLTVFHHHVLDGLRRHGRKVVELVASVPSRERLELPEERVTQFVRLASEWLLGLGDREALVLALVWRHGLSQREVAEVLGKHESNVSRDLRRMRTGFQQATLAIGGTPRKADGVADAEAGFDGAAWEACLLREMGHVLGDDPRLGADRLEETLEKAAFLHGRRVGKAEIRGE